MRSGGRIAFHGTADELAKIGDFETAYIGMSGSDQPRRQPVAIQYTLDSIAYGSLYALMALGLSLLFGVMGLMNFAYGELIMAGAYTMFFTRSWGWLGMILITILIVTILSLLMELVAFRPLRNASPVTLLVTSFAVSYALQEFAWTDGLGLAHQFDATIGTGPQKGVEPYPWLTNQFDVSGVLVSKLEIVTVVVTIAVHRRDDRCS